jgi:hypothetical protein
MNISKHIWWKTLAQKLPALCWLGFAQILFQVSEWINCLYLLPTVLPGYYFIQYLINILLLGSTNTLLCNRWCLWKKFTCTCKNQEAWQECLPSLTAELSQGCTYRQHCFLPALHVYQWATRASYLYSTEQGTKLFSWLSFRACRPHVHLSQNEILSINFLIWTLPHHSIFRGKWFAKWIRQLIWDFI